MPTRDEHAVVTLRCSLLSCFLSVQALQTELLRSCEGAASVGQTLIDSTREFSAKPGQDAAVPMLEAAHAVLQATMKVSSVCNYIFCALLWFVTIATVQHYYHGNSVAYILYICIMPVHMSCVVHYWLLSSNRSLLCGMRQRFGASLSQLSGFWTALPWWRALSHSAV